MNRRIVLGAEHSILEPLALFYLSSIAKAESVDPTIVLTHGPEYEELGDAVRKLKPDFLGFSIYTGNHQSIAQFLQRAKADNPEMRVISGGPHATYFPRETMKFSDYVVVGDGFGTLRRVLRGEAEPGILLPDTKEPFPKSDREDFYVRSPLHRRNRIKNVISGMGCSYRCSHCYNSASYEDSPDFTDSQKTQLGKVLKTKRFFPVEQRSVEEFIDEIADVLRLAPETEFFYFQDDVFGVDIDWLRRFTEKYSFKVPFHANMRFEHINPTTDKGKLRIDYLKTAGCTGLSIAIESSDPVICQEVLARHLDRDLALKTMQYLSDRDFKVRTNQMLGLPLGATLRPTKVNLEADLDTLEFNVNLMEETGLPTFAWASTLTPYPGTNIAKYCRAHGFYEGDFGDVVGEETYRIHSVLRHARRWVGQGLSGSSNEWLSHEEQESYRAQLNALMNYFPMFANLPRGHSLARQFLEQGNFTQEGLNRAYRTHLYNTKLFT